MITITPEHGYPQYTVIKCDQCGRTISEGENIERAEDTAPKTAVLIRRAYVSKYGIRHESFDYCNASCQFEHGIYSD